METLTVNTDLHCQMCVSKIKPILDQAPEVANWQVDLAQDTKPLTVTGQHLSQKYVNGLLQQAGYKVQGIAEVPFWADGPKWRRAAFNTLNCLIGCSIGDFGMVFFLQAYYPNTPMAWQMALAIIAGLCTSIMLETAILKSRERFGWSLALKTALGMSFISMVAMEIAMTGTDFMMTGGKAAFNDIWYWLALVPALVVGFLTPLPYNYYKLKKFNKACH